MMLERFTGDARTVVVQAQRHARRLGHRYIGCEHLLLEARIDASFGPDALTRADQAVHQTTRRPGPARGRLIHRWRHRDRVRRVGPVRAVAAPPEGRYEAADQPAGHIPFTPGARKCLENTLREAVAQHQSGIGVEHIALGLLATNRGLVPPILDEAGLSAPALRAAILDRYRPAS